jgi:hypothetical protein
MTNLREKDPEMPQMNFCATCGANLANHRKTQTSDLNLSGTVCGGAIARLPLVDVNWWIRRHRQIDRRFSQSGLPNFAESDLLAACHPSLLLTAGFVLKEVARKGTADCTSPEARRRVDSRATPAVLALLVEVYIRRLIRVSVEVSQELTRLVGVSSEGSRCLTRSHVYRAILQGAFKGGLPEAIFTSCAEIGTGSSVGGSGKMNPNVIM